MGTGAQATTPSPRYPADNHDALLTPGEVAAKFRVDPKTVTRWAKAGKLSSIRTPGGHRRFRESEVRALLNAEDPSPPPPPPAPDAAAWRDVRAAVEGDQ
jgi:excisionase family DNA binding protein